MTVRLLKIWAWWAPWAMGVALAGLWPWSVATAAQPAAPAQQRQAPAVVQLQDDGAVQFCQEGRPCLTNRHPQAAGKVREIIAGNFIASAPASWIALGERAVSLCYLNAASGSITCAPIANGVDFARNTNMSYISLEDGSHTLKFSARNGNGASEANSANSANSASAADSAANQNQFLFMTSLGTAAELLNKHAARHRGATASLGNPAPASGAGADLCALNDGGGVTCTGSDARPVATADAAPTDGAAPLIAPAAPAAPPPPPSPAASTPSDPNRITTVETGAAQAVVTQQCDTTMHARMARCNDLGRNMGDSAREACVSDVQSSYQACVAAPRGNER